MRGDERGGEVGNEKTKVSRRRRFEATTIKKTSSITSPYLFVVAPELAVARDAREEVGHGVTGAIGGRKRPPWPRRQPRRSSLV